jgi:hypothetical protein
MFPNSYFPVRYYADRYFPQGGASAPVTPPGLLYDVGGYARRRRKRKAPKSVEAVWQTIERAYEQIESDQVRAVAAPLVSEAAEIADAIAVPPKPERKDDEPRGVLNLADRGRFDAIRAAVVRMESILQRISSVAGLADEDEAEFILMMGDL